MIAAFTNVGKERVFSLVGRLSAGGGFMGAGERSDCWMGIDVFRSNCGSRVCRKRGRMYERTDFNSNLKGKSIHTHTFIKLITKNKIIITNICIAC